MHRERSARKLTSEGEATFSKSFIRFHADHAASFNDRRASAEQKQLLALVPKLSAQPTASK